MKQESQEFLLSLLEEQKNKELLLKELCVRLPHGVKCNYQIDQDEKIGTLIIIDILSDRVNVNGHIKHINDVRPYLFPISSLTDEQKEIQGQLQQKVIYNSKGIVTEDVMNYVNWCYENHLDVNDLIPKKLAIDATGLNIY